MRSSRCPRGFTLLEILVALLLVAIFLAIGIPRMQRALQSMRVRASLNQVAVSIYRARMSAVETGRPADLVLRSTAGCLTEIELRTEPGPGDARRATMQLPLSDLCVRHSGDSVLTFNGRGMLRPPARSIYSADPTLPDSVLISIAGRVRRSY